MIFIYKLQKFEKCQVSRVILARGWVSSPKLWAAATRGFTKERQKEKESNVIPSSVSSAYRVTRIVTRSFSYREIKLLRLERAMIPIIWFGSYQACLWERGAKRRQMREMSRWRRSYAMFNSQRPSFRCTISSKSSLEWSSDVRIGRIFHLKRNGEVAILKYIRVRVIATIIALRVCRRHEGGEGGKFSANVLREDSRRARGTAHSCSYK